MIRRLRLSLIASSIFLATIACDDQTTDSAKRTSADASGSGDTGGSETDAGEDSALDTATDTGADAIEVCGNGVVEADEACDDGNEVTEPCGYGLTTCEVCNATCQVEAGLVSYCGDAFVDRSEQCDEGADNGVTSCSDSCECATGFHVELDVCMSDTRSCVIANGTGSQTYASGSWGNCGVVSCDSTYHMESGACVSDSRSCSLPDATAGTQTWTGIGYGSCTATACAATYHIESGACVSDTRVCVIVNGTGRQTYAAATWGSCDLVSCNIAFHRESDACVSDTRSCAITNGTGSQTYASGSWGSCGLVSCDSAYHIEFGACVNDTRACTLLPANTTAGTQTWTGSDYGSCMAIACASLYNVVGGVCIPNLGIACTLNAECASGFCATGPTGTANDRCAPVGMNYIPSGTFTMGSPSGELGRGTDETQYEVTLSRSFFMGQTEVTQGQWKALSGGINPSWFQSTTSTSQTTSNANDSGPVERMDWYAAVAFANARSAAEGLSSCYTLTGCIDAANGWKDGIHSGCRNSTFAGLDCGGYRLPTEAEWEYAARAGTTGPSYGLLESVGWYSNNSGRRTQAVGGKMANSFGLYDMLGNVWEWTSDGYGTYPGNVTDPLGAGAGADRVFRGGAFGDDAAFARVANRPYTPPSNSYYHLGFRLSRTVTRSCAVLPANATAGVEAATATGWGACGATACARGYALNAGACLLDNLGTACTLNDECASAFCSTSPDGTANDRCAPVGMNYIPAGTFTMGSPAGELGQSGDETQHTVTLSRSFFMGQTEVTQGEWQALSGGINPSWFQSTTSRAQSTDNANDSGPAEWLDWYSAVAFANARSAAEGLTSCYTLTGCIDAANGWKDGIHIGCTGATFSGLTCTGYRLPTESEWEYAARARTTTATYGGNLSATSGCATLSGTGGFAAGTELGSLAWYGCNSSLRTHAVGGKTANSFGLSDMLGNVWEWTGDWGDWYPLVTVTDPTGPTTGSYRVARGGSWDGNAFLVRAADRYYGLSTPRYRSNSLGFRLSRTAP